MKRLRVLWVEDWAVSRAALPAMFSKNKDVTVSFSGSAELLSGTTRRVPKHDVTVIDALTLFGSPRAVLDAVRRDSGKAPVVLIEREEHLRYYANLIQERAVGFVTQAAEEALVFKAAAAAARGETWFQEGLFARVLAEVLGAKEYRGKVELDSMEREILALVANGETNKEIASRLKSSERTVKSRLAVLRRKTGAKNRSQLVRYVVANELARLAENGP